MHVREDLNHDIGNLGLRQLAEDNREAWMVPSSRISLYVREDPNHNIGNLGGGLLPQQRNLDGSLLHEYHFMFVKI